MEEKVIEENKQGTSLVQDQKKAIKRNYLLKAMAVR